MRYDRRVKKSVSLVVAVALAATALLLAALAGRRLLLPYNEEGRYFDAAAGVIYEDAAALVYTLLAALALIAAAAALACAVRVWRAPPIAPVRPVPHPANVPGPFYVEDGCCLRCGVWEDIASDLLAWHGRGMTRHCYVARQPETDEEIGRMIEAMQVNEVDCIRVRGCSAKLARRLKAERLGAQID